MNNNAKNNFTFTLGLIKKFGFSYFLITIFLSAFEMIAPIINVYGLKIILDAIEAQKGIEEIFKYILIFFAVMATAYAISAWYKRYYRPVKEKKISEKMRKYFFEIAARIDLKNFDDTEYYNKYIKALSEAETRLFKTIDVFSGLIGTVSSLSAIIVLAISMDWIIILFSAIFIIVNVAGSIISQNMGYIEDQQNIVSQRKLDYVSRIFFLGQYAKEVRSFSLKNSLLNMVDTAFEENIGVTKRYIGKQTIVALISNASNILFVLGTMAYLAYRAVEGAISVGDFAALLTASQAFNMQVESLFSIIPKIHENLLYINYLREFAENKSSIEGVDSGESLSPKEPVEISLENVSFRYPNSEKCVLRNLNGTIGKGKVIAIVGENGVGKTTLVKLLLRLYDVTDGKIKFNNIPIDEYNIKTLRQATGIVFQDFQHYAITVRENICFEDMDVSNEQIYTALQQVGMYEKIAALPYGLDTVISKELDQDGAEFSGGEYQKLSLARSFLANHSLMLFDEPSSSLDPNAEKAFFENIKQLCIGRTAIIVSHRLSISKFADEIWLIHDGEVAEKGSHDQLMDLNGRYAAMFNNQAENYIGASEKDG